MQQVSDVFVAVDLELLDPNFRKPRVLSRRHSDGKLSLRLALCDAATAQHARHGDTGDFDFGAGSGCKHSHLHGDRQRSAAAVAVRTF